MRYAAAKRRVKSNLLRINIPKTKTFSAILKIPKIRDSKPGVREILPPGTKGDFGKFVPPGAK